MKKAIIIFAILFLATAIIPFTAVIQKNKSSQTDELVTIFSSSISIDYQK